MQFGAGLISMALTAAQTSAPVTAATPLAQLDACRAIADSGQRLACFDGAAAALLTASESGELTVIDRPQLRQARRSLFGFSLPRLPFLQGDRSADDDTGTLETTVQSVRSLGYGRVQVVVADGNAIWETTESYSTFEAPKRGQTVTIKRGPLGSYMLRFQGQRAVKGRRIG